MSVLAGIRRGFERLLEAAVMSLMVALVIVVVTAVVFRKLGDSLVWYDEVASVMLAWLTYYGAALAALKRAHIGFSGLVDSLSPRLRVQLVIVAECCVIAFFALLGWTGYTVLVVLGGDALVSLPDVPTRLTQSVIPVGALLFIIAELVVLPERLREARRGEVAADQEASGT